MFVDSSAADIAVEHAEGGAAAVAGDFDGDVAAQDAVEAVAEFVEAGGAAGVFVRGGAAAELVEAGFGVDGVVLPVAVAADGDDVAIEVILEEVTDFGAFVSKADVGVVIVLRLSVRADDGIGIDEDFPGGAAGLESG